MSTFRPMLACNADLRKLRYPLFASPKLDGIRCLTVAGPEGECRAVTRALKPVPNRHIREAIERAGLIGLDGELMLFGGAEPRPFYEISSAVMREDDEPDFRFVCFDVHNRVEPYVVRRGRFAFLGEPPAWLQHLDQTPVWSEAELLAFEETTLEAGYEGVMLRDPHGRYKNGRSTQAERLLLKLKRFEDAEAVIHEVHELLTNENPAELNALGYTERSHHKAGRTGAGVLGSLLCRRPDGLEFSIGSGFTAAQRAELWAARADLPGRLVKYRFQPSGAKDAPRFPVFQGLRSEVDL